MLVDTPISHGKATIRLINPNQSREETLLDMITAIDTLATISADIFSSIKGRLDEQRNHLAALDGRVNVAAERVEQVKVKEEIMLIEDKSSSFESEKFGVNTIKFDDFICLYTVLFYLFNYKV